MEWPMSETSDKIYLLTCHVQQLRLKQHTLKIKQDTTAGELFSIPQVHRTIKLSSFRALVTQDLPISEPRQYNSYYRCLLQSKRAFHQLLGR
jgi:hypothetical protein